MSASFSFDDYQEVYCLNNNPLHPVILLQDPNGQYHVQRMISIAQLNVFNTLKTLSEQKIPGFPKIERIEIIGEQSYIIEEYINGQILSDLLAQGTVPTSEALRILKALCITLKKLHQHQVIHRDIKPDNILLCHDGRIVLLDFGAGKIIQKEQRRDTFLMGTPGFAAPEQFGFSTSDARTDIYALGVLLNVMLTGDVQDKRPLSKPLQAVINQCTAMDPAQRFQSVSDLEDALCSLERAHSYSSIAPWLPPGFRTGKWWKGIIALLGYGMIAFSAFATMNEESPLAFSTHLVFFLGMIIVVLFLFNYGGILHKIPWCTHNHPIIQWGSRFLISLLILACTAITMAIVQNLIAHTSFIITK